MLKMLKGQLFKDLKKMFKSSIRKMTSEDKEIYHFCQNFHWLFFS